MKQIMAALAAAVLTLSGGALAEAEEGVIALIVDDKIIVEDSLGNYTGAELYSYANINEGDTVYGELDSYGMQTWYDDFTGEEFEVYVEDYWMSGEQAVEYLKRF